MPCRTASGRTAPPPNPSSRFSRTVLASSIAPNAGSSREEPLTPALSRKGRGRRGSASFYLSPCGRGRERQRAGEGVAVTWQSAIVLQDCRTALLGTEHDPHHLPQSEMR